MDILSFEISPIFSEHIKFIIFLLFIVLGGIYFYLRTDSLFSIFYRLIILFLGKPRTNTDLINDIVEIEKFNFLYNKNAVSIRQKSRFEKWIFDYELDFKLITKVGKQLDIDNLKLRKIKKGGAIFLYSVCSIFLLFFFAFSIFFTVLLIKDSALLSFNGSGKPFWMNSYEAKGATILDTKNVWTVDSGICKKKIKVSNLSNEELDIICTILNSKDDINYINSLISNQNWFSKILLIILVFPIIFFLKEIKSLNNYLKCRYMIYKKIKKKRIFR